MYYYYYYRKGRGRKTYYAQEMNYNSFTTKEYISHARVEYENSILEK